MIPVNAPMGTEAVTSGWCGAICGGVCGAGGTAVCVAICALDGPIPAADAGAVAASGVIYLCLL